MKWLWFVLVMACATPQHTLMGSGAVREDQVLTDVVLAFASAAERREFSLAYEYLSVELRARYSVERLASDFDGEPLSLFRIQHAARSSNAWFFESGMRATKEWQPGKKITLVLETSDWKVASLE